MLSNTPTADSRTAAAAPAHAVSLEIGNVSQRFGATVALDEVSLTVEAGETVCLLGHSGCGKTTMLRVAAGIEKPDRGTVRLGGRLVTGRGVFVPPEARGIGLMFQDYALFPHLTIAGNVKFGLSALPASKANAIASEALERVGLARYGDDYPHMLSGGEQQRVALARALAPGPGILLMDEPFSNLDQRTRESIREETMMLLRQSSTTCVVVTHDPIEAMSIADRIVLMRKGVIVQTGTPEDIYCRPATLFAARYFCDLNEIPGEASANTVRTPIGVFTPANPVADGPCLVGIRPQAISLVIAGTENLEGTVLSRRFLGESDAVTIAVEGLANPLHAHLPTGYAPAPGEQSGIRIDPAGILAFPQKMTT
ncbi:MAG: ABC transporter ATP-binding protein [Hyphomicrobiales bacterium]|nr:ABC transporter ATP-binding protein [Hyphomicrobiales bacterium]